MFPARLPLILNVKLHIGLLSYCLTRPISFGRAAKTESGQEQELMMIITMTTITTTLARRSRNI
jgi:hypothetical protein